MIRATNKLLKLMLPKLYVKDRLRAPRVAPRGKLREQKYHDPYTPEVAVWIVFLSHSDIQYAAKVMKTTSPMTLALLQPPTPAEQAGLFPGSYLT